jgi:hypothetical protein
MIAVVIVDKRRCNCAACTTILCVCVCVCVFVCLYRRIAHLGLLSRDSLSLAPRFVDRHET